MFTIIELIRSILPWLTLGIIVFFLSRKYFENEQQKRLAMLAVEKSKTVLGVRLQAYERVILLLERISLNNLLLRIGGTSSNAGQMHSALLQTIREEYNHNLSQQTYISAPAWEAVKVAVEDQVRLINIGAGNVESDAPAFELANAILEQARESSKNYLHTAIDLLKSEVNSLYN